MAVSIQHFLFVFDKLGDFLRPLLNLQCLEVHPDLILKQFGTNLVVLVAKSNRLLENFSVQFEEYRPFLAAIHLEKFEPEFLVGYHLLLEFKL